MRFTHERLHGGASSEAPLLHVFHVDTLQEFSYNEHGGVVRSVLRHADAQTPQIVSGTAYQHNGNHILSQTDARGKTVTHDIDENTDLTRAVTDPNGQQVQYAYDSARRYEYAYNARGGVAWVRNNRLNTIARSDYDFGGRPRSMVTQDASGANVYTARVNYDTCGRLARFAEQVGASRAAYETAFGYDREDRPTALTYGSSASKTETAYDGLGRLSTRKVYVNGSAYTTAYAYAPGAESGQTTALVQEITQPGENHSYAYDNVGNIVSAACNGVTTTYAYDALGQLIRVNDPNDGTWTYEYDCGGNILNKKQYAYTTGTLGTVQQIASYAYGDSDWKDKLTRYNGVDIAYDAIGNPIQDGVWTYTWENGRQLRRMACDATIAEFVYNADGLRVQKTVNGVATNYTLHGKNIVHMTKGNAELHFWYDAQNRPAIVEFNGTKYGYLYNLQGDVIGLIDSANTEVVKYTYDAWGKPLSVTGSLANTIGYYNPFRYRGYVYDVETGLYYLRSRYYNPRWGRSLSTDYLLAKIGDKYAGNLFAYAHNAPIARADSDGTDSYYVIYDARPNATKEETNNKGLKMQGEWAIAELESAGHQVTGGTFTTIPEFIGAWNKAGEYQYDYIIIYAHGSPGTIDCNGGYLKETLESGIDSKGNRCYSSINELEEIRVNKGIILLSCNGATPNSDYMTAIGMLSSKADGAPTIGSAYASINYHEGTGLPYQTPGISARNPLRRNIQNIMLWIGAKCWVTFSKDGLRIN